MSVQANSAERCGSVSAEELEQRVLTLAERVNGDAPLLRRGQHFSTVFSLALGARHFRLTVGNGRLLGVEPPPLVMPSWTFAIHAPVDAWCKFAERVPAPGFHDLFAMLRPGTLTFAGDVHPLMANLLYIKGVCAHLREQG